MFHPYAQVYGYVDAATDSNRAPPVRDPVSGTASHRSYHWVTDCSFLQPKRQTEC
jgi:hypothetical protein